MHMRIYSTGLLCTAVALQVLCMPTATARPDRFRPPPQQVYYNDLEREQEMAENNGIFKFWYGTNYVPITTPRDYDVFALQVSSPDRDDAYCLYTMRDNGRIKLLPACARPQNAECKDYTVGPGHTVTVCEGVVKIYFLRDECGPCYDPAKNSCPSSSLS